MVGWSVIGGRWSVSRLVGGRLVGGKKETFFEEHQRTAASENVRQTEKS